MKRTISISLAAVTVALFVVFATRSVLSQREDAGERWEYLVLQGGTVNLTGSDGGAMRKEPGAFSREAYPLERNMDRLGQKGWELVTVTGSPMDPIYYFKRKR